jgi:hypothetical protein
VTRSTAAISTLLALLTGLVLGQLGTLAVPRFQSAAPVSSVSTQDLETARSFYEKLNRFLATGDRTVESLLALDFVDHADSSSSIRNAEQFMVGWSAIRALLPQFQFEVVGLQETGTVIAVRLRADPGAASSIPGMPLTIPTPNSMVEFLRIDRSKVAERWSSDPQWPAMTRAVQVDFGRSGPDQSGPAIQHFSLPTGQKVELSGNDTVALLVTSGTLRLNRVGVDENGESHPASDELASGQIRVVSVKDKLFLRNPSGATTEFLAFGLYALLSTEASLSDRASGDANPPIAVTTLAYLPLRLDGSSADRLRLSVAEITLPAGASVPPHTPNVVEQIVVLDGVLEASLQTGRALVSSGNGLAQPFEGTETASTGQGLSASSIATISYQVATTQPATLLIMTIEPAP